MSEREDEPDDFDYIVREISLAMGSYTGGPAGNAMHIGERLLAAGFHRGPKLPEEGSAEWDATGDRMAKAFYEDFFSGLIGCCEPSWDAAPATRRQRTSEAMLTVLRAIKGTQP